jgi:hypothetical protein
VEAKLFGVVITTVRVPFARRRDASHAVGFADIVLEAFKQFLTERCNDLDVSDRNLAVPT